MNTARNTGTTSATTGTTTTTRGPRVWPALRYTDADAALRFFTEVCGFEERCTYRADDGTIAHGEVRGPEGGGVMYGTATERNAGPASPRVGGHAVYVVTDDPDAVAERARGAGAPLLREPVDTDYGSHEITVADPDGNAWTFGTYPGE